MLSFPLCLCSQASKVDVSVMTDVLRKYGDHLFEMRVS